MGNCRRTLKEYLIYCPPDTVGSLVGYLGFIEGNAVPLALSNRIEKGLLEALIAEYTPAYLWVPSEQVEDFNYPVIY